MNKKRVVISVLIAVAIMSILMGMIVLATYIPPEVTLTIGFFIATAGLSYWVYQITTAYDDVDGREEDGQTQER